MKPLEALFQQGRYREVFDQSRGSSDPQVLLIQANTALELGEGKHAREVLEGLPLQIQRLQRIFYCFFRRGNPPVVTRFFANPLWLPVFYRHPAAWLPIQGGKRTSA